MQWSEIEPAMGAVGWAAARISGLLVFCPFLGSEVVPAMLKVALTVLLTALLWPVYRDVRPAADLWHWTVGATGEAMTGMGLGLMANLLFEGALLAGQVLSVPTGYSLVNVIDPETQVDTPVLSEFHQMAALVIFLGLNLHHWILRALAASFRSLPVGSARTTLASSEGLLHAAGGMFLCGVQIAAPALAVTLIVDVVLGFLAKTSPTLPVLFFGLSIKNILALAVLAAMVGFWPASFSHTFENSLRLRKD